MRQKSDSELLSIASAAVDAARIYLQSAVDVTRTAISSADRQLQATRFEAEQRRLHGLAWTATTIAALAQLVDWCARTLRSQSQPLREALILHIGMGEYLSQILGGLPMSQNELLRPQDMDVDEAANLLRAVPAVNYFLAHGNTAQHRAAFVGELDNGWQADESLGDEALDLMRHEMRRFTDERIVPNAHGWHLANALIPDCLIDEMAKLGVFGISIPPEYGGLGLGKLAMSVISEELSRGWIAAGSLGTRSEIASDLIMANGTPEQRACWLPKLASGAVLPTAVFTEPNTGSDLASLTTQARPTGNGDWKLTGSKTWITHAARSDLMTVLARTDPTTRGHEGLSLFLAPKTRARPGNDFPDAGLAGSEIQVLGYRGMREYVLSFDGFAVDASGLLGLEEGNGFRQIMRTFEGARIQTAARAVGVAKRALELGLSYAKERRQFGKPLLAFPRISDKLAMMAVETVIARELTYFAARTKDAGIRCDIEAGMAKLLAARVAWSNADAAVQIHGGNGYALEYEISRVLCDARILNIFEGAAEIQANVVGRGLLNSPP